MNRFNASQGITPYELLHNKHYQGSIRNFGEPVFGYGKVSGKGNPRWTRIVFLRKSDPQDTYILYNGSSLLVTRSVRMMQTNWRNHLPFYVSFKCWSWQYKTGFGGRVVLTRNQPHAVGGSFNIPEGRIEPSVFSDEDAEAVRLKHLDEQREETEITEMALHDQPLPISAGIEVQEESTTTDKRAAFAPEGGIFNDDEPAGEFDQHVPSTGVASGPSSSSAVPVGDVAIEIPQTPDVFTVLLPTPRTEPTTRLHDVDTQEDHETKRAKTENFKKQRIERIAAEHAAMIRTVKISNESFHTMDGYTQDLQLDDHLEDDAWLGEEEIKGDGVPSDLWNSGSLDQQPAQPPSWVDRLADEVELKRLCEMGVLSDDVANIPPEANSLTTKFVYDWRIKERVNNDGTTSKQWLRRSRLVAREFAFLDIPREKKWHVCASNLHTHPQSTSHDLPPEACRSFRDWSWLNNNWCGFGNSGCQRRIPNGWATFTSDGDTAWENILGEA